MNTNKRKYKIGLPTYNNSNLYLENLTCNILLSKTCYINIFTKILGYSLDTELTKKAKTWIVETFSLKKQFKLRLTLRYRPLLAENLTNNIPKVINQYIPLQPRLKSNQLKTLK